MAKKYYAVKAGRVPGVYDSWDACKEQVSGFPKADFKGFSVKEDAERYVSGEAFDQSIEKSEDSLGYLAFVDGSYCEAKVRFGWGLACLKDGELVHYDCGGPKEDSDEIAKTRNVAGELAASIRAVVWAAEKGVQITIVHDYEGIAKWFNGEWKAKSKAARDYVEFMNNYGRYVKGFRWVRGHGSSENFDSKWNNFVDLLAKEGAMNTSPDPKNVPLP